MKIVFTVYTYYPLKDGVQTITQSHAEGLVKLGHEVIIITSTHGNLNSYEEINGVKIFRVDMITKHAMHRGDKSGYIKLILEQCKESDVLVNVCTQIVSTDWTFNIIKKIKCKKVLYMHGMIDFKWHRYDFKSIKNILSKAWNTVRWKIYYIFIKNYMRKYDLIINLHEFDTANKYCKISNFSNIKIIENGIKQELWNETSANLDGSIKDYFICVSNYTPIKNQEFVLKSFYKTKTCKSDLVFIGSHRTHYLNELKQLKKRYDDLYGYREVKFLYEIDRELIPNYLSNARAFLTGSSCEAFPVVVVEAMYSGIPFISTDVGCVRFLPGGKIVKNIEEMSYWIDTYYENEEMIRLLGELGRIYSKKHLNQNNKIYELENYLKQLLE